MDLLIKTATIGFFWAAGYAALHTVAYALTRGHLEARTDAAINASKKWAEAKIPGEEKPEERIP
jgi:hypothetical protein